MRICETVRVKFQASQRVVPELTSEEADHMEECAACGEAYEHFLFSEHSQEMFEGGTEHYMRGFLEEGEAIFESDVPEDFRGQIRESVRTRWVN